MNVTAVCIAMPILPLVSYFLMSFFGISSMYRVIIPEAFTIAYVIAVAVIVIRRVSEEEKEKKER